MLRTISILLAAMLPLSIRAQENTPTAAPDTASFPVSVQPLGDSGDALLPSTFSDGDPNAPSALARQYSQQKSKPTKPKPDVERPPIEGSMVGYIDNAIVGSQIRIRFDAGFHDNAPDRAEFFYAQCSCINNGPGPNAVVSDLNFQQLYMRAEYAPVTHFSFLAEVPVRWLQPQVTEVVGIPPLTNESGLSDFAAGFKFAAVATSRQYVTFQFQASFPTGTAITGLGTTTTALRRNCSTTGDFRIG